MERKAMRAAMGRRIRQLRERLGMKPSVFARELGVKQPTVYAWEIGKTSPSIERLPEIAALLHVSVPELYGKRRA